MDTTRSVNEAIRVATRRLCQDLSQPRLDVEQIVGHHTGNGLLDAVTQTIIGIRRASRRSQLAVRSIPCVGGGQVAVIEGDLWGRFDGCESNVERS